MITVENLSKQYASSKLLSVDDISFSVKKGEVFGFLGPNGAGKTTTVKMIMGLLTPTKGNISIAGKKPNDIDGKKNIGFLPEHAHLYRYLTAREFLRFTGEVFGIEKKELETRIEDILLQKLKFPPEAIDRPIKGYSKGMQQRVGIAQALINDPEIVFLDEPMSGLDPIGRKTVKDLILHLKKEGKTVFFNSHILNDAEELCDQVAIINKGKIAKIGTTQEVTNNKKQSLEEAFIQAVTE